eukprot:1161328-Pelagomonas_calceolata.AAC.4
MNGFCLTCKDKPLPHQHSIEMVLCTPNLINSDKGSYTVSTAAHAPASGRSYSQSGPTSPSVACARGSPTDPNPPQGNTGSKGTLPPIRRKLLLLLLLAAFGACRAGSKSALLLDLAAASTPRLRWRERESTGLCSCSAGPVHRAWMQAGTTKLGLKKTRWWISEGAVSGTLKSLSASGAGVATHAKQERT